MKAHRGALLAPCFVAACIMLASTCLVHAQDAGKGEKTFNQCKACHALERAVVGPPLGGVIGRKAGSVADYSYSPLLKAAGDAGLVWSQDTLVAYLQDPTEYLTKLVKDKGKDASGPSKMIYKLADETKRKDVAAYLATQK